MNADVTPTHLLIILSYVVQWRSVTNLQLTRNFGAEVEG